MCIRAKRDTGNCGVLFLLAFQNSTNKKKNEKEIIQVLIIKDKTSDKLLQGMKREENMKLFKI